MSVMIIEIARETEYSARTHSTTHFTDCSLPARRTRNTSPEKPEPARIMKIQLAPSY
ncbi:hypothetical protein ASPSYDRAFT_49385 [Aspergillus sydowii CBS 593.65]|uniref:Uncharacterized protein n=1 Tax=Aspergillus sydowii CBS 593.65 TaxID=1036612 RepID=A0A1L9T734_9EURO|nr:uncharacterized protein ASPSYDRAFT_49385 [Aspergillus sydowii CBS 593.65]OJJ55218.1 hypothetical protein ASPSYDRAFT_49385 [Aspergillus sydowii CBS 593.65]